jgi:hypothetical protein
MKDEMLLVHLLIRLRLLIFAFISESTTLSSNSIHGVSMTTLVKIFWSLLGNLSLRFQLRSSCSTN